MDMVERVAMALCSTDGDMCASQCSTGHCGHPATALDTHRHQAIAALRAMRVPTEAMLKCAGWEERAAAIEFWEAMIDDAIAEATK